MATYQIYELSARAVMSYATEQDGVYTFTLNRSATEHCKVPGAKHEQDSCAMFHQLMYQLHGKGWRERSEEKVAALSDVLFYMDFAGIFDRRGTGRTQQARREKARDMFRPEGITLDFGSGPCRYVAYERSASMSRQSRLSFIRAELYEPMRQRIMLNILLHLQVWMFPWPARRVQRRSVISIPTMRCSLDMLRQMSQRSRSQSGSQMDLILPIPQR